MSIGSLPVSAPLVVPPGSLRTRLIRSAAANMLLAGTCLAAQAQYIIDTTPAAWDQGWLLASGAGNHGMAAAFTLTDAHVIGGIEGRFSDGIGTMNVMLRSGGHPNGPLLYEGSFEIADNAAGWSGVAGLQLAVGPGNYTIAFVPVDFAGYASGSSNAIASGIDATYYNNGGGWYETGSYSHTIGLRISPVPEPGAFGLALLGAAAVLVAARRRSVSA